MSSFYETIFLKNDSSLETKLESLKKKSNSNKDSLHMLEAGIAGEKQVEYHLNKSNIGMYVMRDINLEYEDLKAQIDFIVVTSHHCYFIECKNYNADIIHVDESGNFETSTRYGKKYNKMGIKSPISQVEDQLTVFKKICLKDQDKEKDRFKDYFKTIVVFTNPENRLNLKKAPNDIKYRVLKVDNLIRQIEYDDNHFKGKKYSQEQMKQIADYILSKNVEVKVEEIPESYYIQEVETNKVSTTDYSSTGNNKKRKNNLLFEIGSGLGSIILVIFILAILSGVFGNKNSNEKKEKVKINYPVLLTNNQKKALDTFKSGYNDSQYNGFSIIHTSVCEEINYFFENDISCNTGPIEVSYEGNNKIKFYRPLSKTCYQLILSDDNKQVEKSEYKVINDESCRGNPMGFVEWDDDNQYYKKIGGYDKVKELAIYVYKNGQFNTWDFNQTQIVERGGNSYSFSTYFQNVNYYFLGCTGVMSSIQYDTTKDNFNKMVESYYYISK